MVSNPSHSTRLLQDKMAMQMMYTAHEGMIAIRVLEDTVVTRVLGDMAAIQVLAIEVLLVQVNGEGIKYIVIIHRSLYNTHMPIINYLIHIIYAISCHFRCPVQTGGLPYIADIAYVKHPRLCPYSSLFQVYLPSYG